MNEAAKHTLRILPDILLAYGHSDEYSFVFHKSCNLFERRSAKIASTVVSSFTAAYVHLWSNHFVHGPVTGTYFGKAEAPTTQAQLDTSMLPAFDSRCIVYPSYQNLRDYLSWRQADCHINNLYNTTFWALVLKGEMSNTEAEEFLKGSISSEKNELLWSRFETNYNNEQAIFRKGSVVTRAYALTNSTPEPTDGTNELSKTQQEKMRKARQKAEIIIEHIDIIKDEFWSNRPWLITGKPGQPILSSQS